MKNIRRYLGLTLLILAAIAMSSCIKEKLSDSSSEKVNVSLSFNTRGAAEDENEGIKTLRVIISDASDKVTYSFKSNYEDNEMSKTLQIMGMESGKWNFYVIINESSLGLSDEDFSNITQGSALLDKVIKNSQDAICFPKSKDEILFGVPATGYLQNVQIDDNNKNLTIDCIYAVAKIILNIQNNSGMEFTLNKVSFGEICQQGTYLFNRDGNLPDLQEQPVQGEFNISQQIPEGQNTEALVCYLFETGKIALESGFTLALGSDEMPNLENPQKITMEETIDGYTPYTLPRGYKMQINAVVNVGHQIEPSIKVQVLSWDEKNIEIPDFN